MRRRMTCLSRSTTRYNEESPRSYSKKRPRKITIRAWSRKLKKSTYNIGNEKSFSRLGISFECYMK